MQGPTWTPTSKTATSGGAGSALGVLFVIFFPMVTGTNFTPDQAAMITGAIGTLSAFIWNEYQRRWGHHDQSR